MAEIWAAAAITVVGGVISGIGASKAEKKKQKHDLLMQSREAKFGAIQDQFSRDQDYYYQQLEKKEKMRGLDEFRKFSTVQQFAPDYVNTNTGPVLPTKPDANALNFG